MVTEAVRVLADIVKRILKTEKYYIPKFIDAFELLPEEIQSNLLRYITDQVGSEAWHMLYADQMEHRKLLTFILLHYTGDKNLKQPTKEDLALLITDFLRSSHLKDAILEMRGAAESEKFENDMEALADG